MPDQLLDELMADLSGAELKVVIYIVRRTIGFGQTSDSISLSQLEKGITKKDGTQLDRGTGLSHTGVVNAVQSLVDKNIRIKRQNGTQTAEYSINYASASPENALVRSEGSTKNVLPKPSTSSKSELVERETSTENALPE